jgi:hypothetical protein
VLEQKKSLLCSNVHPLMLVYGSWINAILFFVFASSSVMAEILLPQFIYRNIVLHLIINTPKCLKLRYHIGLSKINAVKGGFTKG